MNIAKFPIHSKIWKNSPSVVDVKGKRGATVFSFLYRKEEYIKRMWDVFGVCVVFGLWYDDHHRPPESKCSCWCNCFWIESGEKGKGKGWSAATKGGWGMRVVEEYTWLVYGKLCCSGSCCCSLCSERCCFGMLSFSPSISLYLLRYCLSGET